MIIVKKIKTNDLFFGKFGLKQFNLAKKKRKSPTVSWFMYNYLIIVIIIITIIIIKILNDYFQSSLLFTIFSFILFQWIIFQFGNFCSSVPASVQPITNMSMVEGGNVSLYCNTTGVPDPTVTWSGDVNKVIMGRWLNITNISTPEDKRNNHLIYRCHANNTCGDASRVASIEVLCKKMSLRNLFSKIINDQ